MGLLEGLFGEQISAAMALGSGANQLQLMMEPDLAKRRMMTQGYYDFMAAQRMSRGLEPIDWPTIIVNQFRAEALTRPLTICEKLLYRGAVEAVKDAQENA